MGEIEQGIIEQAVRQNIEIPDRIKNRPELIQGLDWFFRSFLDLSCDRAYGNDIGPIPTMAILGYAKHHDVAFEDCEKFLEIIRAVDGEFLKHHNAKQKKEMDRAKRKAKRK